MINLKDISPHKSQIKIDVEHTYVCQVCGNPATICLGKEINKYSITPDGDFDSIDRWEETDEDEFFCDDCYI